MLTPRRQSEGLRWRTDKPPRRPLWETIKDAMFIIAVLLFILLVHGWTVEQDLRDKLSQERKRTMLADARTACAYVKPGGPRLQCQDAARK